MADWMDPYAAQATNPYLQMPQQEPVSPWMALANLATGIGTGISQGSASGRGWASGLAPGIMYGNQLTGMQRQQAEQQALKRWQLGMMAQEYAGKQQDRELKRKAQEEDAKSYLPPGMRAPASPLMGPGSYDTKVAALEGGTKNGGMVFNELGSGAFGPYQFMPATYADVRAKNPGLNLPEDMTKATREQWDQTHNAFKASNAQALQAAGFQPTPDNLYLAHRFGVGGALSVLKADPNQSLAEVLPVDWQRQNPDMRGQTAGGFRRLAAERVGGGGSVPYEVPQNAQPTQYALMPDQLPGFEMPDGVSSLLPRGNQPQTWTAPVMPQPQATMTPAQYTPPQQQAAPVSDGPPQYVPPPRPQLPDAAALSIYNRRKAGSITAAEARAEANKIIDDLHKPQVDIAEKKYAQDLAIWQHNRNRKDTLADRDRSEQVEGEWVRGPDGQERFVPKAQRKAGDVRYDKPKDAPEPGTEPGDYRILTDGANAGKIDTREYAAAYNRIKSKTIDIGNGQKLPPDMRAFPEPTFKEAQERPAPQPIGERERKFTESESKNHVYATQLNTAIPKLEALVKDKMTGKYSTAKLPGNTAQTLGRSDYFPESLVSEKAKQFREIEMAILTGTLRPASGATILPSEFVSERAKYIPQPNDSPEQIERKLTALKAVAAAIAEGTGREKALYPNLFGQGESKPKDEPIRIDLSGKRK